MGNTSGGPPNDQERFCMCMFDNDNNNDNENAKWIFCHGCESWFHIFCVLITDEEYERIINNNIKWFCDSYYCQNKLNTQNSLSSQTQTLCTECGFNAKNNRGLKVHKKIHERLDYTKTINSSFECKKCKKNFKNQQEMEHHQSCHNKLLEKISHQVNNRTGKRIRKGTESQDLQNFLSQNEVSNSLSTDSALDNSVRQNEFIFHCEHCPANKPRSFKSLQGLHIHITKSHKILKETDHDIELDKVLENLSTLKSRIRLLKRIPKSARPLAAKKFNELARKCISRNDLESWNDLLTFSYKCFQVPIKTKKSKQRSLASIVKENINQFEITDIHTEKLVTADLKKRVEAKISDFDVKGAIRLLCSQYSFAPTNQETVDILKSKHPPPSRLLDFPSPPSDDIGFQCEENNVKHSIMSFGSGSAAGMDGFYPQYFKDLISTSAFDAGNECLSVITELCNFMLRGKLNDRICQYVYGASLCALTKKDGGIRPIAVGLSIRRLVSKIACSHVIEDVGKYLFPIQLGVGVKQGCEAVVHATRSHLSINIGKIKILLKIDFRNAFNSIERDVMLSEVKQTIPSLYPYLWQCYRNSSLLFFGENTILSQIGAQQGDPLGPLLFSLTIHKLIQNLKSELNVWYLDDGTVCDDPDIVYNDFKTIINESENLGLHINPSKCELFFLSGSIDEEIVSKFNAICPGICVTTKEDLTLLGAPLFEEGFIKFSENILSKLKIMFERLKFLNSHTALFLLKNCFAVPKLTYLIRTSPAWNFEKFISAFDDEIKDVLETIINVDMNYQQWTQATLPVNFGGLGIRRLQDISLPAFLSSSFGVKSHVSHILNFQDTAFIVHLDEALEKWKSLSNLEEPSSSKNFQKNWDLINIQRIIKENLNFTSKTDVARFKALQCKESNAWLHAIPSSNIGTVMDNNSLRICIGLRLGCNICSAHTCKCESLVSPNGLHGLSCSKCTGKYLRHVGLNDIIYRTLSSLHIPANLEPIGLSRNDGKRPDGVTLTPWFKGKPLIWDATCVDTFADSYITKTSTKARKLADYAASLKHKHYSELMSSNNYILLAFAVETMGPWSEEAIKFIDEVGYKLQDLSGDKRSKFFLMQRISMEIQRYNAACIMGTISQNKALEEVFYL